MRRFILSLAVCGLATTASAATNVSANIKPNFSPNDPNQFPAPFIIGGSEVQPDDPMAKMVVALDTGFGGICTATIIAPGIALTAAHCIDHWARIVFSLKVEDTSPNLRVLDFQRHENYNGNDVDRDDIALLFFKGNLPAGYAPVQLATPGTFLNAGDVATLSGFGVGNLNSTDDGSGILRRTEVTVQNPQYGIGEISFDQTKGNGACYGDSGGPAWIKDQAGHYFQIGVTSRGKEKGCTNESIYTSVIAHYDWILKTAEVLRLRNP